MWELCDYNPCFAGGLPSTIFNISSLLELSLEFNQISGKFPKDPCNKPAMLEYLDLRYNKFHGEILTSLFQCHALQNLSTEGNEFTGSIPNEIGNLSALQWLSLDENGFSGKYLYLSLSRLNLFYIFNVFLFINYFKQTK